MNEIEAWVKVEQLYDHNGVNHPPLAVKQVCLLTAIGEVTARSATGVNYDKMMDRLHKVVGESVPLYNDSHSKEENLAAIAQCRSECAAEHGKSAKERDMRVHRTQDSLQDNKRISERGGVSEEALAVR